MAKPSVIAPVSLAFDTVKRVLFQPFDMTKWFGMGFTAWLAALWAGCGSLGNGGSRDGLEPVWGWAQAHMALVITIVSVLAVMLVAISLVVAWISARGKFMFLDNVVKNRGEIREPWQRLRVQGNSYFLFSICFGLAVLAVLFSVGLALAAVALPNIAGSGLGFNVIAAIILGVVFFGAFGLIVACALVFLDDFVVPIMLLRSCRIMTAWSLFWDLFRVKAGLFVLYLLFKLVLCMAVGIVTVLLCCALCCLVAIPYLGTVIMLPLLVFMRSYSIHFLEQFGESYRLFD